MLQVARMVNITAKCKSYCYSRRAPHSPTLSLSLSATGIKHSPGKTAWLYISFRGFPDWIRLLRFLAPQLIVCPRYTCCIQSTAAASSSYVIEVIYNLLFYTSCFSRITRLLRDRKICILFANQSIEKQFDDITWKLHDLKKKSARINQLVLSSRPRSSSLGTSCSLIEPGDF